MQISLRARIARAWQDLSLLSRIRAAIEALVTVPIIWWLFLRFGDRQEANANVKAVLIAVVAGFFGPLVEFLISFVRAPLAIENDSLREELGRAHALIPGGMPSAALLVPGRDYVREDSGHAVWSYLKSLPWQTKDTVANTYVGRWVRGRAIIMSLNARDDGGVQIFLREKEEAKQFDLWGFVIVRAADRYRVGRLDKDDEVTYDGKIVSAGSPIELAGIVEGIQT